MTILEAVINLPVFQSDDQTLQLIQTKWSSILNPIISNPSNNRTVLGPIALTAGVNLIAHKLGRKLQGWNVVLKNAAATFYDGQATNQKPELFLILNTSAPVTVSIEVF